MPSDRETLAALVEAGGKAPCVTWTPTPETLDEPLRARKPRKILVADVFDQPFEFIAAVYGVMAACPQHRFIILTKRPKRMREFVTWMAKGDNPRNPAAQRMFDAVSEVATALPGLNESEGDEGDACWRGVNRDWPLPNVIHGYSAAKKENNHD